MYWDLEAANRGNLVDISQEIQIRFLQAWTLSHYNTAVLVTSTYLLPQEFMSFSNSSSLQLESNAHYRVPTL